MKKRLLKYVFFIGVTLIIIVFISLAAFGFLDKTSQPSFCGKCHVMQDQYTTWIKGGLHNNIKCIDCHIPNDTKVNFYIWKGIDGTKDLLIFHMGIVPEMIKISSHGKRVIQSNCIRCHEGMVSKMLNIEDRNCWDCHKRVSHKLSGLRETV